MVKSGFQKVTATATTQVKEEDLMDNEGKDAFSYGRSECCREQSETGRTEQSSAPGSQTEDGELVASSKKEKPFPSSCNIWELVLVDGNLKKHQEKHLALIESHASLFHAVHSIAKSYKRTAGCGKGRVLGIKELHPTSLGSPEKEEDLAPLKDTGKDKGTSMYVHSKHLLMSKSKSVIFRMQQNRVLEELPPAVLIPYVVLIKNCISLPVSTIQNRCLSGEILCRMEFFTVSCRKKKSSPPESAELSVPKLPRVREVKYATFDSLKDLQWKLFKGFLKRKPKTIGVWREPTYSSGIEGVSAPKDVVYILPLMPKDWIIDSSLRFSEEMRHLLLRKE
ncbi:hypothetical protein JRQ81_013529 [Phrynocephalus forsythii]|uniref:Uncharacterized protein n=1 Tax=Phrynocephalus forsythii TaxID=171643 RepID=A0A9Q0Y018_9SAUR|nr:hypothetical protein JRQ81_013529 [Phrynocephalus forsythii]